ncbi:MAG: dihydroorotate dehydrogenase electron transfer subunit [Deltaproteobacteria bacterium]|nr:dihydroorotate dehydrogenase electron transfer subunit [Deltaproteobacteria bacterium]
MRLFYAEVKSRQEINAGIFTVRLAGDGRFGDQFIPGQFVMVGIPEAVSHDPLLRRPFSVARVFASEDEFELAIKVVGRGTTILQHLRPGELVPIHGPLGNGYPLDLLEPPGKVIMVAGGLGIASLLSLLDHCRQRGWPLEDLALVLGARSAAELVYVELLEDLARQGLRFLLATEDGSRGQQGLVTAPLTGLLAAWEAAEPLVFSCGPLPMLRAVCRLTAGRHCRTYLSLESRMACGFGACLGCVTRKKEDDGSGSWLKVCLDGPVFPAAMLPW